MPEFQSRVDKNATVQATKSITSMLNEGKVTK